MMSQKAAPVIAMIKQEVRRPNLKRGERRSFVTNGPKIAVSAVIEFKKVQEISLTESSPHSAFIAGIAADGKPMTTPKVRDPRQRINEYASSFTQ
jgi:hypothetical protein